MCVRARVCVYLTKFVQLHFEEIEHIFENKGNFCPFEFVANECLQRCLCKIIFHRAFVAQF